MKYFLLIYLKLPYFCFPSLTFWTQRYFFCFYSINFSQFFSFFSFSTLFFSLLAVWRASRPVLLVMWGALLMSWRNICIETCKTLNFWLQSIKLHNSGSLIADFCKLLNSDTHKLLGEYFDRDIIAALVEVTFNS